MVDLQQAINPQPIVPPPAGTLSRPVLLSSQLADLILFHDTHTLYAYLTDGSPAWHIKARAGISGFVVSGDNLYVQDGYVLCQYDTAAQRGGTVGFPDNALSFRGSKPHGWSIQGEPDDAKIKDSFDKLFEASDTAQVCSAPTLRPHDNRVHVLKNDGHVFSPLMNLQALDVANVATNFVPDQTVLYLAPVASGKPQLCWISSGKVAVMETGELRTPSEGLEAWRWNCLRSASDQPSQPFGSAPEMRGFISGIPSDNGGALAITLYNTQAAQWSFHLVAPACFPLFSVAGSMPVRDAASGATITYRNDGIVFDLAVSIPPYNAQERAGWWAKQAGVAVEILTAPYLRVEDGGQVAYAIARIGSTQSLCKFRVPEVNPIEDNSNYIACWWQTVRQTFTVTRPLFAKTIVHRLQDAAQAAVDAKVLPADCLHHSFTSPLIHAAPYLPWNKFDAVQNYAPLTTYPALLTQIDPAVDAKHDDPSDSWMSRPVEHYRKPNAPLAGPVPISVDNAEYLVVSNRYGIYAFKPDATLAWRISATSAFAGWTQVGGHLFVSEGGFLARYDIGGAATGQRIQCPDMALDVSAAGYWNAYHPNPKSSSDTDYVWGTERRWDVVRPSTWFDYGVGPWAERRDAANDYAPYYNPYTRIISMRLRRNDAFLRKAPSLSIYTSPKSIAAFPQGKSEVISIPIDGNGAFVADRITSSPEDGIGAARDGTATYLATDPVGDSDFVAPFNPGTMPAGFDFTIDAVTTRWQPPAMPHSFARALKAHQWARSPGDGPWTDLLRRAQALRINIDDDVPVDMSPYTVVREQNGATCLYCSFTTEQKNYFAKYTLPN